MPFPITTSFGFALVTFVEFDVPVELAIVGSFIFLNTKKQKGANLWINRDGAIAYDSNF
ncbi:hypothetical protein TUM4249_27680 [Shewanella sp. KT0246]|nr:hypothetical protein TUM4249_27680 [Shewanella sp. KT0246]